MNVTNDLLSNLCTSVAVGKICLTNIASVRMVVVIIKKNNMIKTISGSVAVFNWGIERPPFLLNFPILYPPIVQNYVVLPAKDATA
jgi:hypothetical protein